jgi:uncharacterized OsmC-like protein
MSTLIVHPIERDRFEVTVRDHMVAVDQPEPVGADTAPTPVELFVASLATCVAHYARQYLVRHDLPTTGLAVTADYAMGSAPSRVRRVDVDIRLPEGVPMRSRQALLAVASHCTVHNTLTEPPDVSISTSGATATAAA